MVAYCLALSCGQLITTSSSPAPAATEERSSLIFVARSCVPSWNPMTLAIRMSLPLRLVAH